eukprot:GHVU01235476.1.p2 GENE.GHVU01235476.1~~GHVU01235476.1.p2  ORF type:complete len:110 (+),score=11.16 GHVU01235476.1:83-412(+)
MYAHIPTYTRTSPTYIAESAAGRLSPTSPVGEHSSSVSASGGGGGGEGGRGRAVVCSSSRARTCIRTFALHRQAVPDDSEEASASFVLVPPPAASAAFLWKMHSTQQWL